MAEKREEMEGAQEAATAAVLANMRRAEVEQENADILNELIEIKVCYYLERTLICNYKTNSFHFKLLLTCISKC